LLAKNAWFWGFSSRIETDNYLRLCASGTFLLRFANAANFRLSFRTESSVLHFVVKHVYQSAVYRLGKARPSMSGPNDDMAVEAVHAVVGKRRFSSLPELAHAVGAALQLQPIAPQRSPFLMMN
jgi:hypothetical protein